MTGCSLAAWAAGDLAPLGLGGCEPQGAACLSSLTAASPRSDRACLPRSGRGPTGPAAFPGMRGPGKRPPCQCPVALEWCRESPCGLAARPRLRHEASAPPWGLLRDSVRPEVRKEGATPLKRGVDGTRKGLGLGPWTQPRAQQGLSFRHREGGTGRGLDQTWPEAGTEPGLMGAGAGLGTVSERVGAVRALVAGAGCWGWRGFSRALGKDGGGGARGPREGVPGRGSGDGGRGLWERRPVPRCGERVFGKRSWSSHAQAQPRPLAGGGSASMLHLGAMQARVGGRLGGCPG